MWSQNGVHGKMCVYWSKDISQVVIMDTNMFYDFYPELDKHRTKQKGFELSIRYPASNIKNIIKCYPTYEEASKIAEKIMNENPEGVPLGYIFNPPLLAKFDKYKHTNHYIKNRDRCKFPYHEVGSEGVLLSRYFGAIDKAVRLGVTVWRPEGKEYKRIEV